MSLTAPRASVRELFFQTIIYGIGLVVSKTVNFILLPVYTNYFSPEQLGLYNLIYSIWMFAMVFYTLGLETSFIKFFTEKDDVKSKSEIYSTSLTGTLITSVFFSIILFFLSYHLPGWLSLTNSEEGGRLIRLLSIVMIFDLLYRFPLLELRSQQKPKTFFFISNIFFISNLLLNILFIIVFRFSVDAILYSYLISSLLALVTGLVATKKFLIAKFSMQVFKEMIKLGSNFILMGFFLMVIEQSDKFFLKYFYDESIVGIYGACYRLGSVMLLAIMAFKLSWTPYFLNISKNTENKKVIANVFTYFIFAGLYLFLFFYLFINIIVTQNIFGFEIINQKFWSGLKIVPVILLSFLFSGLYLNFSVIPLFTNKSNVLFWISLGGCLLNLIFNFILIPQFEMMGAAYATLVSYIFMFGIIYFISQRAYFVNYEWKKILIMTSFVSVVCIVNNVFISRLQISTPIYIIINLVLMFLFLLLLNNLKIIELKKFIQLLSSKKPELP